MTLLFLLFSTATLWAKIKPCLFVIAALYLVFTGIGGSSDEHAVKYKQKGTVEGNPQAVRNHALHQMNQRPDNEIDHQIKSWDNNSVVQTSTVEGKTGLKYFVEYWDEKHFDNPDK